MPNGANTRSSKDLNVRVVEEYVKCQRFTYSVGRRRGGGIVIIEEEEWNDVARCVNERWVELPGRLIVSDS